MSAKHSKKGANRPTPAAGAASPTPALAAAVPAGNLAGLSGTSEEAPPAWIDSADPKKRMWGKIILVGIWIYVGALWLLALDQTFGWGIFGPKVSPVP